MKKSKPYRSKRRTFSHGTSAAESLFGKIPHYRDIWIEQRLQDAANKVIVSRFAGVSANPSRCHEGSGF
jgi:hypothetical protein